jgi:hypothetical protein
VLITALRSSTGAAAETVRLALRGELTTLMDYKLACEYRDVALRAEQLHVSGKSRAETARFWMRWRQLPSRFMLLSSIAHYLQTRTTTWFWMWQSTGMPTRS